MTYRRTILFLAGMTVSMMIGIGSAAGQTSAFSCPASDGINPLPNVKAAISANDQAFLKAVLAQDKAALDAMISNDFVYVHETGLISTKQQFLQDFVAKGYIEAVLEPLQPAEPMRQYCSTYSRTTPATFDRNKIVLTHQASLFTSGLCKIANGYWSIAMSVTMANQSGSNSARRVVKT